MKLIIYISFFRTPLDELLNQLQLLGTTKFKTTGFVKDKTRVALEYYLILDVILLTLRCEDIDWTY